MSVINRVQCHPNFFVPVTPSVSIRLTGLSFFLCKAVESLTVANDVCCVGDVLLVLEMVVFPSGVCLEVCRCARPLTGVRRGHSHGGQGPEAFGSTVSRSLLCAQVHVRF